MSLRRNSSMDSSIASDDLSDSMSKLMCMVKQSKKVFVGTYTEKRYVQSVPTYRDIVSIDKEETEVIKCLIEIQKVVRKEFGQQKFLGITCNMENNSIVNYNLWVELDQVPLGKHWFQIRSLKMNQNSIQLQLKYLRPYKDKEQALFFNDSKDLAAFDIKQVKRNCIDRFIALDL
uniref:GSTU24_2 protein n=1 Tax=Fopius arisanus TaxID=64838 RepID=A0A0C9R4P5_9HYME